jgi:hypothetical protein
MNSDSIVYEESANSGAIVGKESANSGAIVGKESANSGAIVGEDTTEQNYIMDGIISILDMIIDQASSKQDTQGKVSNGQNTQGIEVISDQTTISSKSTLKTGGSSTINKINSKSEELAKMFQAKKDAVIPTDHRPNINNKYFKNYVYSPKDSKYFELMNDLVTPNGHKYCFFDESEGIYYLAKGLSYIPIEDTPDPNIELEKVEKDIIILIRRWYALNKTEYNPLSMSDQIFSSKLLIFFKENDWDGKYWVNDPKLIRNPQLGTIKIILDKSHRVVREVRPVFLTYNKGNNPASTKIQFESAVYRWFDDYNVKNKGIKPGENKEQYNARFDLEFQSIQSRANEDIENLASFYKECLSKTFDMAEKLTDLQELIIKHTFLNCSLDAVFQVENGLVIQLKKLKDTLDTNLKNVVVNYCKGLSEDMYNDCENDINNLLGDIDKCEQDIRTRIRIEKERIEYLKETELKELNKHISLVHEFLIGIPTRSKDSEDSIPVVKKMVRSDDRFGKTEALVEDLCQKLQTNNSTGEGGGSGKDNEADKSKLKLVFLPEFLAEILKKIKSDTELYTSLREYCTKKYGQPKSIENDKNRKREWTTGGKTFATTDGKTGGKTGGKTDGHGSNPFAWADKNKKASGEKK